MAEMVLFIRERSYDGAEVSELREYRKWVHLRYVRDPRSRYIIHSTYTRDVYGHVLEKPVLSALQKDHP